MTSRARVTQSLMHKEPDMIPIDLGSTRSTGINALAYFQLLKYHGISEEIKIYDIKQLLAEIGPELRQLYQSDCIQLYRHNVTTGIKLGGWKHNIMHDGNEYLVPSTFNPIPLPDGSDGLTDSAGNVILKRPAKGLYFDDCFSSLALAEEESDLDSFEFPKVDVAEIAYLKAESKRLFNETDYAIVLPIGVSLFEKGIKDFGYENFLVLAQLEEPIIFAYLERLTEAYIKLLDAIIDAVGDHVQVFQTNDDLGMQSGPLLPPDKYRSIFKPYHEQIFSHIHKKAPNSFVLLHCCGSIRDIIPDLIEAGVNAINPVQINAANMDPAALKRDFGKDITFWGGGVNTQGTLTFGSISEIKDEIGRMIEIFGPGGGFIFNTVHNIQNNISPEKIDVVFKEAILKRQYKAAHEN